jgi:hypothetical protein
MVHVVNSSVAIGSPAPSVLLRRYRQSLGLFISGLILAGLTAFPIAHELRLASSLLGIDDPANYAAYTGLRRWIAFVDFSVRQTYAIFPSAGYGTDWLAFAHLAVAVFAVGPWRDPVHNGWVINCYLATCIGVIPLALICGAIREIPVFWRLIDCSFGVLGALPLLYCRRLEKQISVGAR